jgi:hypothetical protein
LRAVSVLPCQLRHYVGEPVDVRGGLLSKEHVEAIVDSVRLEMNQINKENEVWWEADIVTKAAQLGLSPMASKLGVGIWIARCPGTNHNLELQRRNLCVGAENEDAVEARLLGELAEIDLKYRRVLALPGLA